MAWLAPCLGLAWPGLAWLGLACLGLACLGLPWLALAGLGLAWLGFALGLAWPGLAWLAWLGLACKAACRHLLIYDGEPSIPTPGVPKGHPNHGLGNLLPGHQLWHTLKRSFNQSCNTCWHHLGLGFGCFKASFPSGHPSHVLVSWPPGHQIEHILKEALIKSKGFLDTTWD